MLSLQDVNLILISSKKDAKYKKRAHERPNFGVFFFFFISPLHWYLMQSAEFTLKKITKDYF